MNREKKECGRTVEASFLVCGSIVFILLHLYFISIIFLELGVSVECKGAVPMGTVFVKKLNFSYYYCWSPLAFTWK